MVGQLFGKDKKLSSAEINHARQVQIQLREKLAEAKRTRQYMREFQENPEVYRRLFQEYYEIIQEAKKLEPLAVKYTEALKKEK